MRQPTLLFCSVLAVLAASSAFGQDWDQVEVAATHVAGSVYMVKGAGGNIGVSSGEDGIVLIDDQFAPLAAKIQGALDSIGKGQLRFVLNTHYHGDHTGGNEHFGAMAPIVSHINVRERLMNDVTARGQVREALPKGAWPVLTFTTSVSLHFNGEDIEVVHFPHAHTDGDAVVFFPNANVVHMGDIFFNGMLPFVDRENGGSVSGTIEAVEAVLKRCDGDTKIICGHGDLGGREGLEAYLAMLQQSVEHVKNLKNSGKSLEEIKGTPIEAYADWASSFVPMEAWLETVYRGL